MKKRKIPDSSNVYFLLVALLGLAAIFFAVTMYGRFINDEAQILAEREGALESKGVLKGTAEVQFDFGNGTKRKFAGDIFEGVTVLDAVLAAADAGEIDILYKDNAFVSIGARVNGSRHWQAYKNEKKVLGSLNSMPIGDKDTVELRYE
jgi:hypothetical protein